MLPTGIVLKSFTLAILLEQNSWSKIGSSIGSLLIVIVKETVLPTHPFIVGVTVTVEKIAFPFRSSFVAVNEGKSPIPEAGTPIAVFEFVQSIVAPVGFETIGIEGTSVFSQKVRSARF